MEIRRSIYKELKAHLAKKEISLLIGARQVGKTTLMQELYKDIREQSLPAIWFNLDIEEDKGFFESQSRFLQRIQLEFGDKKGVVFIDEVQRKENAGVFLKGLYDQQLPYKFVVSGSGSLELKEQVHESLVGRKRVFIIPPVSFTEFVDYKTSYRYSSQLNEFFTLEEEKRQLYLEEYLNFGGYPRVVTETAGKEKLRLMNEIFTSYIDKDIAYLLRVDRPEAFSRMVRIASVQAGGLVNYSNLANETGV